MSFGTVRSLTIPSWFQVQCTQRIKWHRNRAIWRVFSFPDVYSYGNRVLHDLDKATLHCSRHSSAHSGCFSSISWKLFLFADNVSLWSQFDHLAAHISSRSFVQTDANNTETVLFTEECNVTCTLAHEANRCTFWTSCTGVSFKRPFLSMMLNFKKSWLTELRILVGRVMHTGTQITLKMSYIGCFLFSFCQGYMLNKRRHSRAGGTAVHMFHGHYSTRDWVVHILCNSNVCVRKTLFPVHNMNFHTVRSLSIPSCF